MTEEKIIKELQELLDGCLSNANQEGKIKITSVNIEENTGTATFEWCLCEGEPYFRGY